MFQKTAVRRFSSCSSKLNKKLKEDKKGLKKSSKFLNDFTSVAEGEHLSEAKAKTILSPDLVAKVDYREFPKVDTPCLNGLEFRKNVFYSGYRPLTLPLEAKQKLYKLKFDKTGAGSGSGKNNFEFESSAISRNIWNYSAVGTEHFKEMDNIPYNVLMKLKPYQKPPVPNGDQMFKMVKRQKKETNWKAYFSKRVKLE